MRFTSVIALVSIVVLASAGATASLGCGDDDCEAAKYCARKNDAILSGDKIVPICDAETKQAASDERKLTS